MSACASELAGGPGVKSFAARFNRELATYPLAPGVSMAPATGFTMFDRWA